MWRQHESGCRRGKSEVIDLAGGAKYRQDGWQTRGAVGVLDVCEPLPGRRGERTGGGAQSGTSNGLFNQSVMRSGL